jgi:CRP-like cAMP-binding protein
VRRLKGAGEAPQGFPNAIPLRYANVPLFSAFSTRTFVKVLEQVRVHRLDPETLIIKEGEKGNAIFAVADGVVRVTKEVAGQVLELATLPSGSFFGEMAMLTGAPRRASVWTVGAAEILEIPKPILDAVAAEAPTMGETLRRFFRERLLQTALATGALFRGLDPASRDKLVHRFRTMEARAGATVLEEGKPADGLYVIVDGVLQVHKADTTGKRRALAVLRGGDFFGEMSLLYGGNAAATVSVSETATLLKLARNVCEEVLRERPEMVETIRRIAEERRKANDQAIMAAKGKPTEGSSPA